MSIRHPLQHRPEFSRKAITEVDTERTAPLCNDAGQDFADSFEKPTIKASTLREVHA